MTKTHAGLNRTDFTRSLALYPLALAAELAYVQAYAVLVAAEASLQSRQTALLQQAMSPVVVYWSDAEVLGGTECRTGR